MGFVIGIVYTSCGLAQDGYISGVPKLAYWTVGSGPEVIIVLHGGPAAGHQYLRPELDQLSAVSQVIYFDQRGCGKSEKATCYGWREQVADVKRVVNRFSNSKKVSLAGSSWGYILALLYAYTYPDDVKTLILSGTYEWPGKGMPTKNCSAYILKDIADTINAYDTFPAKHSHEYSLKKAERILEHHLFVKMNIYNSLNDAPAIRELRKLKVPILMFKGIDCKPARPPKMRDHASKFEGLLPNLEIYRVAGACHDPWYTHTDVFFKKCIDYIRRHQ